MKDIYDLGGVYIPSESELGVYQAEIELQK